MENMNENEFGYNRNNGEEVLNNPGGVQETVNEFGVDGSSQLHDIYEPGVNKDDSGAADEAYNAPHNTTDNMTTAIHETAAYETTANETTSYEATTNETAAYEATASEAAVNDTAAYESAAYHTTSCVQPSFSDINDAASEKKNKKENKHNKHKESGNKERKQHGFVYKAVRNTACAVLLGAVAGASCYGTMYAGYLNFPIKTDADNMSEEAVASIAKEIKDNYLSMESIAQDMKNNYNSGSNLTNVSAASGQIQATVIDVSDIVSNVISSVVAISGTQTITSNMFGFGMWGNYSQSYEAGVSGSGIIIGSNDTELLVVTNAHVVDGVNNLKVTFCNDIAVDAVIKGMKSESDLAVVAIKLDDIDKDTMAAISAAKLGSSTDIEVGEAAIAIGNAAGYGISVTTGIVSAVDKSLTVDDVVYEHLIQTDAAINPGNSGGALFNAQGEVIGINSVKMSDTSVEGMGYAISIESVRDIIDDLSTWTTRVALDNDERGYLGVTGKSVTADISSLYGWPQGVLVKSVSEDSAAEQAGLQVNDVIVSFDGKEISSWETLVNTMQYYDVGETVEVTYYHLENGSFVEKTVSVTLTERPESSK